MELAAILRTNHGTNSSGLKMIVAENRCRDNRLLINSGRGAAG
jgi:hypothetical protein